MEFAQLAGQMFEKVNKEIIYPNQKHSFDNEKYNVDYTILPVENPKFEMCIEINEIINWQTGIVEINTYSLEEILNEMLNCYYQNK